MHSSGLQCHSPLHNSRSIEASGPPPRITRRGKLGANLQTSALNGLCDNNDYADALDRQLLSAASAKPAFVDDIDAADVTVELFDLDMNAVWQTGADCDDALLHRVTVTVKSTDGRASAQHTVDVRQEVDVSS